LTAIAVARSKTALVLCALLATLVVAASASAQQRDFAGKVVTISAQSLAVKDRRQNIVTFTRSDRTTVEGKSGWDAIAVGDQVIVRWKLGDGTARHVIVLEAGQTP
jgi:hypothetical protein